MPTGTQPGEQEKREHKKHKAIVEDERGWAGQRGQRPANEEEKNYRTGSRRNGQPSNSNSPNYD